MTGCCLFALTLPWAAGSLWAASATITVDAAKPGPKINPRMYGIFLEEINHGVDGGLYAELVRNRGFEDSRAPEGFTLPNGRWLDAKGYDAGFSEFGYKTDGVPFRSLVRQGNAQGAMSLETSGGVTEHSSCCLRLDVESAADGRVGVANEGFFGIGARNGQRYELSLYAKGQYEGRMPSTGEATPTWSAWRPRNSPTNSQAARSPCYALGTNDRAGRHRFLRMLRNRPL